MADRFKFRVWDKTRNQFIHDIKLNCKYGHMKYPDVGCYTPEQCTGLKDKNGKLIFEGDIVKCGNEGQFIYVVGFNRRFASFVLIRKKDAFYHYFGEAVEAEDVEVIGNIRENMELVK